MRHKQKLCFGTLKRILELSVCAWHYPLLLNRSSGKTDCKSGVVALLNVFMYEVWIDLCVFSTRLFWSWTNLSNFFFSPVVLYTRLKITVDFLKSKLAIAMHNTNSVCFSLVPPHAVFSVQCGGHEAGVEERWPFSSPGAPGQLSSSADFTKGGFPQ